MKYLQYTHPAVPPVGITVGQAYDLEVLKKQMSLDMIKILFTPVGWKWSDIEKVEIKK